jgi:hypothetical protein
MKRELTSKFMEGQKPNPSKRLGFRVELIPGLVLRISTAGTKTFCPHKCINGKMRRLAIRRFGDVSLAEAHQRMRQVLYEMETGHFEEKIGILHEAKRTLGEMIPDHVEKYAKVHNRDWKRYEALLAKFTALHGKRAPDALWRTRDGWAEFFGVERAYCKDHALATTSVALGANPTLAARDYPPRVKCASARRTALQPGSRRDHRDRGTFRHSWLNTTPPRAFNRAR